MSPAVLAGLGVMVLLLGAGVLVVEFVAPATRNPAAAPRRSTRRGAVRLGHREVVRLSAGVVVGVVLGVSTGWIVLVPLAVGVLLLVPYLFSSTAATEEVEKLEAMRAWTRSLSGLVSTGASLENALRGSLGNAPEAIRKPVGMLVARLQASWRTPDALEAFAQELDHSTGDLIAAHLMMAAKQRGPGLATALDDLAVAVFDEVKMRRAVIADRAKPQMNLRIVVVLTVGLLVLLPFARQFSAGYASAVGQMLYLFWVVVIAAVLVLMHRSLRPRPATRLMGTTTGGVR